MRTLSEISKDINETTVHLHALHKELKELQDVCWHDNKSKDLFSSCAGHIRKWKACLSCGKEFDIEYDDDNNEKD